jgi:hypothetical protein
MKKKNKVGRPKSKNPTTLIALRLPSDLVTKLKATGNMSQAIKTILEQSVKLTALVLMIACGNEKRCFTKAEAIMACQVEEMSRTGVDAATAQIFCEPRHPHTGCYKI